MNEYPVTKLVKQLEGDNLLPAILFRTSRRHCNVDVEMLARSKKLVLPEENQAELKTVVEKAIKHHSLDEEIVYNHEHYSALIEYGTGAHHAGQLLSWRLLLEEVMSQGMLRLLVATGTVAAGVDFPARTVIITAHSKRGSEGFNVLTSSELQQMSGRAGRRGKDNVGICLVAPGPFADARVVSQISKTPPEPLTSAYYASPSTVLNLLKYRNVDDLRYTVSRSLASFLDQKTATVIENEAKALEAKFEEKKSNVQLNEHDKKKSEKRIRRKFRDAKKMELRQEAALEATISALERLGHIEGNTLTDKGIWSAELCTNLVLELAEAIDSGLFYDLQKEELAALVASIAGDSYRTYLAIKKNPVSNKLYNELKIHVEKVRMNYSAPQSSDEVKVQPDAALTVLLWMESEHWSDFASMLRLAGVAEGDAARLISQTADHLNQLTRLSESHQPLAKMAEEVRKRLLRPPMVDDYATA